MILMRVRCVRCEHKRDVSYNPLTMTPEDWCYCPNCGPCKPIKKSGGGSNKPPPEKGITVPIRPTG